MTFLRKIVWTSVLATLFALASIAVAVFVEDRDTLALTLGIVSITFAVLSLRE